MSSPPVRIDIYRIHLPFRINFRHSKAERNCTENIVVRVMLADGVSGYGECVPRAYVTGETPESVYEKLAAYTPPRLAPAPLNITEVLDYTREWVDFGHGCHSSNASRCALELALLDAYGRKLGFSFSDVARHVLGPAMTYAESVKAMYSAPISATRPAIQFVLALGYKVLWRFRQMKIKIGLNREQDLNTLARIYNLLDHTISLRCDVNGVWNTEEAISWMHELRKIGVEAVEEPVRPEDIGSLRRVREETGMPVILDESLRSMDDARRNVDEGLCDIFNIRISKVGGFVRALEIARFAMENGIGLAFGCQVGETAILSAAGRHFVTTVRSIRYCEGSYDSFLLKENLTRKGVDLRWGGIGDPLPGPGLGINVLDRFLEKRCESKQTLGV